MPYRFCYLQRKKLRAEEIVKLASVCYSLLAISGHASSFTVVIFHKKKKGWLWVKLFWNHIKLNRIKAKKNWIDSFYDAREKMKTLGNIINQLQFEHQTFKYVKCQNELAINSRTEQYDIHDRNIIIEIIVGGYYNITYCVHICFIKHSWILMKN